MQLYELLMNTNKIKNGSDMAYNFKLVTELAKDDVYKVSRSKNLMIIEYDYFYSESIKILESQLEKKHLKSIKRFLENDNIEKCAKWLVARILNNILNISKDKRYKKYCDLHIFSIYNNTYIDNSSNEESWIIEEELSKLDNETIEKYIKKIYENNDLSYDEVIYLCDKFKLKNITDTVDNLKLVKHAKSCNFQLEFNFNNPNFTIEYSKKRV